MPETHDIRDVKSHFVDLELMCCIRHTGQYNCSNTGFINIRTIFGSTTLRC